MSPISDCVNDAFTIICIRDPYGNLVAWDTQTQTQINKRKAVYCGLFFASELYRDITHAMFYFLRERKIILISGNI